MKTTDMSQLTGPLDGSSESDGPRFKPYPKYKNSDVDWLGEIPADWEVRRLRTTILGCHNGIWGDPPTGKEADVACVRVADFDRVKFEVANSDLTIRSVAYEQRRVHALVTGDLLLEKSGGGEKQPVGVVVLFSGLDQPAVCSNFIARMPVQAPHDPRFLTYLHATLYAAGVNTRSIKQSIGIQNLDSSSYLNEHVAVPAPGEQHAIADFLDRETGRIDALVEKKERLIELLQEKRTALITRAVTKGLDPNVPRKDSGVEWLGQIPAHWDVMRVKWAARLESGHTPDKKVDEYWENGDIPWVSLNDTGYLKGHDYISETAYYTNELGLRNSSARLLPAHTVVFSRDATIGLCAITARSMAVSQHFIAWVCSEEMRPEYLLRVFEVMTEELERLTMGATLRTIGMPDVKTLITPVPPRDEQDRIVHYILDRRDRIDSLIGKVQEGADRLREYRTALISAAVTGKIDVREEIAA